ncbi:MAG: hypothetical protein IJ877_08500 [Candidatus Gastranaerophilales bacterium]|nr:hypothetical protein [Candidatus Gastranaerophilales bacterium]
MKKLLLLLVVMSQCAYCANFNFNSNGDKEASAILKNFVENKFEIEDVNATGYFYDINQDGQKDVIGIVKSNIFYTLEGYKLIILKNEQGNYTPIKCEVFFDNSKEISIDNNEINYYKTVFYKNKKCSADIKNDEVKIHKTIADKVTDKKVQNIEQLTRHGHYVNVNNLELSDFKAPVQKNVNVKYNNLSEKTKHYLDMK